MLNLFDLLGRVLCWLALLAFVVLIMLFVLDGSYTHAIVSAVAVIMAWVAMWQR